MVMFTVLYRFLNKKEASLKNIIVWKKFENDQSLYMVDNIKLLMKD